MKTILGIVILTLVTLSCKGQPNTKSERHVGGPCEGCEATLDYKLLNLTLNPVDTIPGFLENTPKIKITGTVFKQDGKTPAENVILYVYQVDKNGLYKPSKNPLGWESRHGQYRTWLKTNIDGKFTFYTFKPASYPGTRIAKHIHIFVKEPSTNPYYLDSYHFEDDPYLTEKVKSSQENRGGSGIINLKMKDGILTANRDLILGLNIPNYNN